MSEEYNGLMLLRFFSPPHPNTLFFRILKIPSIFEFFFFFYFPYIFIYIYIFLSLCMANRGWSQFRLYPLRWTQQNEIKKMQIVETQIFFSIE